MTPLRHIVFTLPLSTIVWYASKSYLAGFLCFFSGVLIDIDHLVDYFVNFGLKTFNPKKIYCGCGLLAVKGEVNENKRLFLFLHAIEIAILLWLGYIFSPNSYILALSLGYSGHLALDLTNCAIKPCHYFIISRLKHRFKTVSLLRNY